MLSFCRYDLQNGVPTGQTLRIPGKQQLRDVHLNQATKWPYSTDAELLILQATVVCTELCQ